MSSSASEMYDELQELEDECVQALKETQAVTARPTGLYCEGMFDGWSCWNDTPAGHVANQSCPTFVTGFEPDRFSYKKCNDNGTWFRLQATNKTWTNYSTCVNMEDLMWQQQVTSVYKAGYSISLVALVLSLVLLSYFRSLRCARIILHMNLFASFAINAALWLLWYAVLVNPVILHENWIGCQILHVVLHYFLLTNYAWMLCEGLYLHTILVSAFISESTLLVWLHLLGWGVPVLFIVPYTISRVCVPGSIDKATLLLVPLLGLNYLLTPFRPPKNHSLEKAYDITAAITASFQSGCWFVSADAGAADDTWLNMLLQMG
ncbi:Diuretic hormone 31 Receptor [Carabus blaptoides fortunei]